MKTFQPYFWIHLFAAILAYVSFGVSFVAGLVYLYQDWRLKHRSIGGAVFQKLPSLEGVERLIFRTLWVGLPLLTLALISGFIWLKIEFGTLWIWNSKITASIFAWIVYSALFYFHYISSIRGRKVVVLNVLAFILIVFTFVGLHL